LYVGSKLCEGLVTSGRRIDGTVHAALAVRLPAAEEPDGGSGIGDLHRVYTDLARSIRIGNEAGVKPILLSSSIELPCAWVGKAALGDSVVSATELEVDNVALLSGKLLRVKLETRRAVLASTHEDGDVGGRDERRSESGDESDRRGSGELHGERMKRLRGLIKVDGTKILLQ